ncbi:uncharacterized protein [Diadema antillarum]|uniref:uncharacterized protein n=1 Tax=Diadema antillarum TaxID=105358 RepID=UPI003A85B377
MELEKDAQMEGRFEEMVEQDIKDSQEKENDTESPSPFADSTFNVFDGIFVLVSMGLLVADLITDSIVTCKYFVSGDITWGSLTLAFTVIPSVILQIFSIRWYLADDDMSTFKWIVHICQVGPLHRYINAFRTGLEARRTKDPADFERLFYQQSDVCMLRLFESFLESAPQVVLQLYIMVATNDENFWTGTSAMVSLFSLCWALGAYSRAHRKVRRDKKIVSWPGLVLQTVWRIGMISSRVAALVLFASVFKGYIFLVVALHWLGMMTWVHLQQTDFCSTWAEERLFNAVVSIIYIFCFFNLKEGRSRLRVLVFYTVLLVEDSALLAVWYNFRTIGQWYVTVGFSVVFGGFAVGVVSMILYYRFLHPSKDTSFCGLSGEKDIPGSLEAIPPASRQSSLSDLFSPELYPHGRSPSPRQPRRPDINHNEADSPLARPLSATSIHVEGDLDCKVGVGNSHKQGSWRGQGQRGKRSQSQEVAQDRQTGSDICVTLEQQELVAAQNATFLSDTSLMRSIRCDISGFGSELVQRFDDRKARFMIGDESIHSAICGPGDLSRSHRSLYNQTPVHATDSPTHRSVRQKTVSSDEGVTRLPMGDPPMHSSPALPRMPEIVDSPNRIMTAYDAQKIYEDILGIEKPRRNSKRQLKFDGGPKPSLTSTAGRKIEESLNSSCKDKRTLTTKQHPEQSLSSNQEISDITPGPKTEESKHAPKSRSPRVKKLYVPEKMCITENHTHYPATDHLTGVGAEGSGHVTGNMTDSVMNDSARLISKHHEGCETESVINPSLKGSIHSASLLPLKPCTANNTQPSDRRELMYQNKQPQNPKDTQTAYSVSVSGTVELNGEAKTEIATPVPCEALDGDLESVDELKGVNCQPLLGETDEGFVDVGEKEVFLQEKKEMKYALDRKSPPGIKSCKSDYFDANQSKVQSASNLGSEKCEVKIGRGINEAESLEAFDAMAASENLTKGDRFTCRDDRHASKGEGVNSAYAPSNPISTPPVGRDASPHMRRVPRGLASLSPHSAIFGQSHKKVDGQASPLVRPHQRGFKAQGGASLKRVRSLKGSAPASPQPVASKSPGSVGNSHQKMNVYSDEVNDRQVQVKARSSPRMALKGSIKRVLSIKGSASSEKKISSVEHTTLMGSHEELNADDQSVQTHLKNPSLDVKIESKKSPSPKVGILTVNNQNEQCYNPLITSNTQSSEHKGNPSSPKTGDNRTLVLHSGRTYAPGKENKGVSPGTVMGVTAKLKGKVGSPLKEKKPPRRSLGRIPNNLVAEKVAAFSNSNDSNA